LIEQLRAFANSLEHNIPAIVLARMRRAIAWKLMIRDFEFSISAPSINRAMMEVVRNCWSA
jgi:hypothetical protein